jgi:hypothetical protein
VGEITYEAPTSAAHLAIILVPGVFDDGAGRWWRRKKIFALGARMARRLWATRPDPS